MREQTYPGSYESHLRRRVKELEDENEDLRAALRNAAKVMHDFNGDRKWFIEELRKRDEDYSPTT